MAEEKIVRKDVPAVQELTEKEKFEAAVAQNQANRAANKRKPDENPDEFHGKIVDVDATHRIEFEGGSRRWYMYIKQGDDPRWQNAGWFKGTQDEAVKVVKTATIQKEGEAE